MRLRGTWALAALAIVALCVGASGCSPESDTTEADQDQDVLEVGIGVMPITAALPVFVADEAGLFEEHGLDATVEVFHSGQDRNAAFMAEAIDLAMGDPVSLILLESNEFPTSATMILLGATAAEGRDGIVAGPASSATTLEELAGVPVGTSLGTHQEYIVDMLFAQAGVDDVVKEEVKKVPIRYELLMEGQIQAAAMAEPWLTLAQHNGARLVMDDTHGANISQELLFASDAWLETEEGEEAMTRVLAALDEAVDLINDDREAWRDTLFTNAGVPDEIRDELYIDIYPHVQLPTEEMLDMQIDWMLDIGLIDEAVPYEELVWEPEV